jgi:hypothetical protein
MIRTAAAQLGFTLQCTALSLLALTALLLALYLGADVLYGVAAVVAFLAGSTWDRQLSCDGCGTSLEDRS